MFSDEFQKYFFGPLNNYFIGVFPFNKIPKFLKVHHFAICNTDNSNSPGQHWFAIYKSSKDVLEVFDPLSVDSSKRLKLQNIPWRNVRKIKFNVFHNQLLDVLVI